LIDDQLHVSSNIEFLDTGFKLEFVVLQQSPLSKVDLQAMAPALILSHVIHLCKDMGVSFIDSLHQAQKGRTVPVNREEGNLA
jgi:uncharacterized metal-binding protein